MIYTRHVGLDRDTNKGLLLKHIWANNAVGTPFKKNCDKDDCAGQVTLVSQCDGLTRVMTESQRHILTDRKYVVWMLH